MLIQCAPCALSRPEGKLGHSHARHGFEPARVMIMGGWSDLKTMQIYMRKAGISIKGMTDGLNLHDPNTKESKVINMFERMA